MKIKIKSITIFIFLFFAISAISSLILVKQFRILLPDWYDVQCVTDQLCLEDIKRRTEAEVLYRHALQLIETKFSKLDRKPRAIFCSTNQCSQRFGLNKANAQTVGSLGIIISNHGWKQHLVNHEFIHYWQVSMVGNWNMLQLQPWLREGMAYAMSGDPRKPLAEPFEGYRNRFNAWCQDDCRADIQTAFLSEVE